MFFVNTVHCIFPLGLQYSRSSEFNKRNRNTQLQDKNTELRIQNAQLQTEAENHVAISEMKGRFAQQLK
ncbi:hypothetical protein BOTNAR_0013g00560 [Botryotinia narcissicola]|uniref:Uncharacterized protein n=1 Tax=Botryotinia narcissicola TaxID=278944 RepID=A0A4Z1JCY9_9HELO|nr:hypothetical protein BOTNAR_0013g00560 [Botryotinia narcissicola]